ncbi:TetR/AcrR family transcriptional regulator [Leucobacter japonicus]|uniref:TetR/AcrR family transcriptional regulator n=1 Tax=Leucobacter japonicus TaxID=1461259 RepID=UPI0006A79639|nr:TetR/AcrR family transcriptional regulator [Leucobacter japonicus]
MSSTRGRPHASSREMLADAACELFLERGYEATSVTEVTRRAGVSRSSFFNYFASKSEILWYVFDRRIAALDAALADASVPVATALRVFASGEHPDALALAVAEARTMGVEVELAAGRAERQLRIADLVGARLRRDGVDALVAEIQAAGYAAALVSTVWRWAHLGAGRHQLNALLLDSLDAADTVFA